MAVNVITSPTPAPLTLVLTMPEKVNSVSSGKDTFQSATVSASSKPRIMRYALEAPELSYKKVNSKSP